MRQGFAVLSRWLEWLDSHDGRLHRRDKGQNEDEFDCIATIPNPPGSAIFTLGNLREVVTQQEVAQEQIRRLRDALQGCISHIDCSCGVDLDKARTILKETKP